MKFLLVFTVALTAFVLITHGYPHADSQSAKASVAQHKTPNAGDDSDMYMEPSEQQTEESHIGRQELQQDQSFYPSFSPFQNQPLGHSRPYYFQQEGAYSQRAVSPFQQQLSYDTYRGGGFAPNAAASSYGLLGSGNFGVIRGGTFYNDNDGDSSNFEQQFSSYYHNGHGRPSVYFGGVPNTRAQPQEQFANFRDFADINTPSYSQYVVVYANKNGSKHDDADHSGKKIRGPKNIIEQLAMLDLEVTTTTTEVPIKKLSKSKRKLALLLPDKKLKRKQLTKTTTAATIDLHEPLLALS